MLELTQATTANARARVQELSALGLRCFVRCITAQTFALRCVNPEHPAGHVVRFSRHPADGVLSAECVLRAAGEACPAELGKRVCYHIVAAAALFEALERGVGRSVAPAVAAQSLASVPWPQLPRRERVRRIDLMLAAPPARPWLPG